LFQNKKNHSLLVFQADLATGQANPPKSKRIPMIVDLAFATNVRFLDEHELHLDDVQLYKVFYYMESIDLITTPNNLGLKNHKNLATIW